MSKLLQHETDHLNGIIIADRTIEAMKNNTGDIYPYFEGEELDNFELQSLERGYHCVELDAGNNPSGIYFLKLETTHQTEIKKLTFLR